MQLTDEFVGLRPEQTALMVTPSMKYVASRQSTDCQKWSIIQYQTAEENQDETGRLL